MKEVKTEVNGVETTLLLDDEDARKLDESGYQRKRADEQQTKARKSVDNKSA